MIGAKLCWYFLITTCIGRYLPTILPNSVVGHCINNAFGSELAVHDLCFFAGVGLIIRWEGERPSDGTDNTATGTSNPYGGRKKDQEGCQH